MAASLLQLLLVYSAAACSVAQSRAPTDPCKRIAGKKWALPSEVRACITSFPVQPEIKANVIEVVNKTLAFHTSVNYQIKAPAPFDSDVREDLMADLARIEQQGYSSDFELHLDLYRSFKRVNDGHCGVYNRCYDSLYVTYLPIPLVLLTNPDGSQSVHIAAEAFEVASAEFGDDIEFWQNALPGRLKGRLSSLSGARVHFINGKHPFATVDENALTTGTMQSLATRQNLFFASYNRGSDGWTYSMGNFAQQVHPLIDSVKLTIQRLNETTLETIVMPYRSRFGSTAKNFTDSRSYRQKNCMPTNTTNGHDMYDVGTQTLQAQPKPVAVFQQQPAISPEDARRHPVNVLLDGLPLTDIELPSVLQPKLPPLNESYSVAQFYMLNDNVTGVLALGSFSAKNITAFAISLLTGLESLKSRGARRLIVDVTNNGGGYICIAHVRPGYTELQIIGPKGTTEPQAGLDTTTRASLLAQLIVDRIANGADPANLLYYNSAQWTNASHVHFAERSRWLHPLVTKKINGHDDIFSQRLGQECQPFEWAEPPPRPLFEGNQVAVVSNGKCGSSCSLFSISMAKLEGAKTVVVGGRKGVPQQYCGTVGGQSTDFATMDTEIKTTKLKNHTLAPPDFMGNNVQGITWRLGFGIDNKNEPEEWQDHPAAYTFDLTVDNVNNPAAVWDGVAAHVFRKVAFQVQY